MTRQDALTRFADWFDDRTGYRAARAVLWDRKVPGGPRWAYATGVCTLGLFAVVAVTGVALMTGYSPAADHGWSSVFLTETTPAGRFLRGLHYWGSHALIVLFAVHAARLILSASFRAPRELAWISAILLLPLLAVEAMTGNPLSASNKAVGQIDVESHIIGNMPVIGALTRKVLLGGDEVGNLTLTRLYALHVAVLPLLAALLLMLHLYQTLRWGTLVPVAGTTAVPDEHLHVMPAEPETEWVPYRPSQTARNALVFGVVFGVVSLLAWRYGAPLDAPADPTLNAMPRPEWYFRALFELRGYVGGPAEVLATGVLPVALLVFLVALPWIDRVFSRRASVALRYAVVVLVGAGWAGLTALSYARDRNDSDYLKYQAEAGPLAERARLLAASGIPPEGPAALLAGDPLVQGPRLFREHCATCHPHLDAQGNGVAAAKKGPAAPNLYGFAGREWVAGVLDPARIAGPHYFGPTKFGKGESGGMIDFVRDELFALEGDALAERKEQVRKAVLALSAEAALPGQADADKKDSASIAEGRKLLAGDELGCVNCHKYRDAGELGSAPDLTGYGSRDWVAGFVSNPGHERFYGENNDGMPSFAPGEAGSPQNILSRDELLLVVDWLRGDWVR